MTDPSLPADPRVAVVTGAGSGIGRAVARLMLSEGYRVALAGRREAQLLETADGHPDALAVPCDVTVPDDVARLFEQVRQRWGRVDVLFNNAGIFGPAGDVGDLDIAEWEATLRVNVTGSMLCAAEAVRTMKHRSHRAAGSSTTDPSPRIHPGPGLLRIPSPSTR